VGSPTLKEDGMSETSINDLSGVTETMLITVYIRAMETQRPDAMLRDHKAVELVSRMSDGFDRARRIPMSEVNKTTLIMRNREFDRYAASFLARRPEGVVVHIGCGLDSRFERVDNGRVEWYDLDFPNVIELRRKLIGSEGKRCHLLGCWCSTRPGRRRWARIAGSPSCSWLKGFSCTWNKRRSSSWC
jgi:O-methyltransferase involved in polyketide biosynthesis